MLSVENPPTDTVCFHAQQCAEKALKAFLVMHDEHVQRTHSLPHLIERCRQHDDGFERFAECAPGLTVYAVTGRYPDDWIEIGENEARAAIESATAILHFVESRIS